MPTNTVDFTFGNYKRSSLFLKKPPGIEVPDGWTWLCPCGTSNLLKRELEQYCPTCGSRLRIQEQRQEGDSPQNAASFTVVRVSHFTIKEKAANGA